MTYIILVLGGVHAAAELVAGLPEGGVEFGFLEGHGIRSERVGRRGRGCAIQRNRIALRWRHCQAVSIKGRNGQNKAKQGNKPRRVGQP